MPEMMARVAQSSKGRRLSIVAVSGLSMTAGWTVLDQMTDVWVPASVVSAITALALFLAGWVDVKAKDEGYELWTGDGPTPSPEGDD